MAQRLARLLLFWDYDTQWGADRSRAPGRPKTWGQAEFANTERLLELHAEYSVRACFAIVGAAALPGERPYHDPMQIRRIHAAGHEIGSHSFRHEWLPGLGYRRLRATLQLSRETLEQCIGAAVVTFVPPYNQPFDYAPAGSISLSERLRAGPDRIDLTRLCATLRETGYAVCRVSYRAAYRRALDRLLRRRVDWPVRPEFIAGVTCIRLNTPGGFATASEAVLTQSVARGGTTVVYGHPHSLHAGNSQDESWLIPFLKRVRSLCDQGLLSVCLPRDLEAGGVTKCPSLAR